MSAPIDLIGRTQVRDKQKLAVQLDGHKVPINTVARDKRARSVAKVKVGGSSVNNAMNEKLKK
jgi:hypothetical protein